MLSLAQTASFQVDPFRLDQQDTAADQQYDDTYHGVVLPDLSTDLDLDKVRAPHGAQGLTSGFRSPQCVVFFLTIFAYA